MLDGERVGKSNCEAELDVPGEVGSGEIFLSIFLISSSSSDEQLDELKETKN